MANPVGKPAVHRFDNTREAYDETQCRDDIKDGDLLVIAAEGVVGFLDAAWPVAITEAHGEFHHMAVDATRYANGLYETNIYLAKVIATAFGFPLRESAQTA